MRLSTRLIVALAIGVAVPAAPVLVRSQAHPAAADRIIAEGLTRSGLMQTLGHLTDEIGPRPTNSPNFRRAATWTRDQLAEWGLQNAHLEKWGPFGRGWSVERFSAEILSPDHETLIALPKGWSPGTRGELATEVVYLDAGSDAELQKYKGRLANRIVLLERARDVPLRFAPLAKRWSDEDMRRFASDEPYPPENGNIAHPPDEAARARARFTAVRLQLVAAEGAALLVEPSHVGGAGTVGAELAEVAQPADTAPDKRIRAYDVGATVVPQVVVSAEQYNRIVRRVRGGQPVVMSVNLSVRFDDSDLMSTHTMADLPGTDLKDEIVMVGAHLDSWHGGTGATDNGAGVAVVMEAVRILQALKLQPRRTIRVALWGGEEVGGGARDYVRRHLGSFEGRGADRHLVKGPDFDRYSAYFNMDAGTGKIRGVYLAGNAALRPILRPWLKPYEKLGATTLTINGDWGSDFRWFDEIGIPIVSFIQDEIAYDTLTHHTNMDVLDHVLPEDLKQAAVVMAGMVWEAANAPERLPRVTR